MACDYTFANLAAGDGTALKLENVQNVEKPTLMKKPNDIHEFINITFPYNYLSET